MNIPLVSIFYDISSSILPPLRVKSWLYHAVPMTSPITRYPLVICDSLLLTIAIKSLLIYPAITSLNMVMFHRFLYVYRYPKEFPLQRDVPVFSQVTWLRLPGISGCQGPPPSCPRKKSAGNMRNFLMSKIQGENMGKLRIL